MRRAVLVPALAGVLIAAAAPVAAAAPPERETFTLVCDNGQAYEVVVSGGGEFTPGRIVSTTGVVIPIGFGDFFFRAELPDGTVITETEPGGVGKGGGNVEARSPRTRTTCTFEDTFVLEEEDPEFGLPAGTEVTFGGEVTVFLTPAKR